MSGNLARSRKSFWEYLGALVVLLTLGVACPAWAATNSVIWTTQADFERNAASTGKESLRLNTDTATSPGDVLIGLSKEIPNAPVMVHAADKIFSIGAERNSVAVIDASTKALLKTIALPDRPVGMAFNAINGKLYIGKYDSNIVWIVDEATETITAITVGNGACPLLSPPDRNKVYVANSMDNTVSVIAGDTGSVTTVPVVAGPYLATYDNGNIFITNKNNHAVSVIKGATDEVVTTVAIEAVTATLSPLEVDATALGITESNRMHLKWNYSALQSTQKIQFQLRTGTSFADLETLEYTGPGGTGTWYDATAEGAVTSTEQDGTVSTDIVLANLSYAAAAQIKLRLISDDTTSPILHLVSLVYESLPDLLLTDVSGAIANGTINYAAIARNTGSDAAGFYTKFDLVDNAGATYPLGTAGPTTIQSGNQAPVSGAAPAPANLPPQNFAIRGTVDYDNRIPESEENNNSSTSAQSLYIHNDLTIPTATSTVSGGMMNYSITLHNAGNGVASAFGMAVSAVDQNGAAIPGPDYTILSLQGGGDVTFTGAINLPSNEQTTTTYKLKVIADPGNAVPESNEDNNTWIGQALGVNNDLIITAISGTVTGGKLNYSVTVKNIGNGKATNFATAISLTDWNAKKYDMANPPVVSSLSGGEEVTLTGSADIPSIYYPGFWTVSGKVDSGIVVPESDEDNNCRSNATPIYIYNDLIVTGISGSVSNGYVTYTCTIKNIGNAKVGLTNVDVFFKGPNTVRAQMYQVQNLVGGAEDTHIATTLIPAAGTQSLNLVNDNYVLSATVDNGLVVPEKLENNNSLDGTETFYIFNELSFTEMTTSFSRYYVTANVGVKNSGNGNIYAFTVDLFLQGPNGDIPWGQYLYFGQNFTGGKQQTKLTTSSVSNIAPGEYNVRAVINFPRDLDPSNNEIIDQNKYYIFNDMTATNISGSVTNGTISYNFTFSNLGNWSVTNLPVSITLIDENGNVTELDNAPIGNVNSGGTKYASKPVPSGLHGRYTLRVTLNGGQTIPETVYTNNSAESTIDLP